MDKPVSTFYLWQIGTKGVTEVSVSNSSCQILVEICTVQPFPPLVRYQTNWNSTCNIVHCVIEFHGLVRGDMFLQHFIPFRRTIWAVKRNQSINPVNAPSLMVGESKIGLWFAGDLELQRVFQRTLVHHTHVELPWCRPSYLTAGLVRLSGPVPSKEPLGICSSPEALQSSVMLPLKYAHHKINSC